MKPSRWNFFMKKFTRDLVVPTISARVPWEMGGTGPTGWSCLPYRASSSSVRASRFSLELKSWSIRSSAHADGLTRQAPFAEELPGAEHRHDRLTAALRQHRELDVSCLDVQHVAARIALGEDDLVATIRDEFPGHPGRVEEGLGVESRRPLGFQRGP